jgi:hypothetical protein
MQLKMTPAIYLLATLIAGSRAASAQAPPEPATPAAPTAQAASAQNCGPTRPLSPRGTTVPEGGTTGQRNEPLSDQLAKSDGVLCPPAGVDPDIRAPTPDTGSMKAIPPPGSPGGDPSVRPK